MINRIKSLFGQQKRDGELVRPQIVQFVPNTTIQNSNWYPPLVVPVSLIGAMATSTDSLRKVFRIIDQLEQDEYTLFVKAFCDDGLKRFSNIWQYADITTALYAASNYIKPQNYLEIGVRRGRSLAIIAACNPDCQIVALDMWPEMYANISNPGPDFVKKEIMKIGFKGKIEFVNGDSHLTLPSYFESHPEISFDLVTVDGDHSEEGARQDLLNVLPRIKVGGAIIFDDISHPLLPYLKKVWNDVVVSDFHFSTWEYSELGFGVAIAIRRVA